MPDNSWGSYILVYYKYILNIKDIFLVYNKHSKYYKMITLKIYREAMLVDVFCLKILQIWLMKSWLFYLNLKKMHLRCRSHNLPKVGGCNRTIIKLRNFSISSKYLSLLLVFIFKQKYCIPKQARMKTSIDMK